MRTGALDQSQGGTLRISARPGLELPAGGVVTLHVLKRLTSATPGAGRGSTWAVGIGGKVLPARTELDLQPGQILAARVAAGGGRIVLTVLPEAGSRLHEALRAEGISLTAQTIPIVAALVRSGQPIQARLLERVRGALAKARLDPQRGARLVATLADKGIELTGPGVPELLQLASLGERGGRDPRRYRGRELPADARAVKESIAGILASGAPESGLQVYNALKGRSETWIIVPFLYRDRSMDYPGIIKLLIDPWAARLRAMVLSLDVAGCGRWHFRFDREARRRMAIWCDSPACARQGRRALDMLRAKVHNMRWEVDDIIGDGSAFDGFSAAGAEDVPASELTR